MAGIVAIFLLVAWLFIVKSLTRHFASLAKSLGARRAIAIVVFPALLLSPLADEIIGLPQVVRICNEAKSLQVDERRVRGRQLRVEINPSWAPVKGTILPVRYSHFSFREINSNEEAASFNIYRITGGWLSRAISFNGVNGPFLGPSYCDIGMSGGALIKKYGGTIVN